MDGSITTAIDAVRFKTIYPILLTGGILAFYQSFPFLLTWLAYFPITKFSYCTISNARQALINILKGLRFHKLTGISNKRLKNKSPMDN